MRKGAAGGVVHAALSNAATPSVVRVNDTVLYK
jgi:hypothetical protein